MCNGSKYQVIESVEKFRFSKVSKRQSCKGFTKVGIVDGLGKKLSKISERICLRYLEESVVYFEMNLAEVSKRSEVLLGESDGISVGVDVGNFVGCKVGNKESS